MSQVFALKSKIYICLTSAFKLLKRVKTNKEVLYNWKCTRYSRVRAHNFALKFLKPNRRKKKHKDYNIIERISLR